MAKEIPPYFSHDANAAEDHKVIKLNIKYPDYSGYGLYWRIVEELRKLPESGYKYLLEDLSLLAHQLRLTPEKIKIFIQECCNEFTYKKIGLFKKDDDFFWSDSLIKRMELKEEKSNYFSELGKNGAKKRWNNSDAITDAIKNNSVAIKTDGESMANKQKKTKIKETKTKHEFVEFVSSCFSLNSVEVEKFFEKLLKNYPEEIILKSGEKINTDKNISNPFGYITGIVKNLKAKEVDDDYYSPV